MATTRDAAAGIGRHDQRCIESRERRPGPVAFAVMLATGTLHAVLFIWSATSHSPSIDEAAHLAAGVSHLQLGRFELYAVNPPLAETWAAIPVVMASPLTDWTHYRLDPSSRSEFLVGHDFVHVNGADSIRLHFLGRISLLAISLVGLCVVYRWALLLYGTPGAIVAVMLMTLSPEFLGHGSVIGTDVSASVLGLLAISRFRAWLCEVSLLNTILLGGCMGLALLSKMTWCVVLPITFAVVLPVWRWFGQCGVGAIRHDLVHLFSACLLSLWVVNAGYAFDGTFTRLGDIRFVSKSLRFPADDAALAKTTVSNRFTGTALGRIPVPVPACYLQGIDIQKRDFERDIKSYLMGQWRTEGWWYYYLVAFAVKIPHATQILILTGLGSLLITRSSASFERQASECSLRVPGVVVEPRCAGTMLWKEWLLLLTPATIIFVVVGSQTGMNHHFRYVLPALPFLYLIAARIVTCGYWWKWFAGGLLVWQFVAVMHHAPHWLSYFNEASGGPEHGHDWLVDSNIDWGQDILMLKWWQDEHPVIDLQAALFSGFDPKDIGLKYRLPPPYIKDQSKLASKDGLRGPQPGWYAVSVCQLKGHWYNVPEGDGTWFDSAGHFTYFMDHFEPVEMIGYSIYICHITEEQAAAVRAKLDAEGRAVARSAGG